MNPGVQYPHCEPPRSAISRCTGCNAPAQPRPSAVTTSCWSNAAAGTRQALIATQRVRSGPSGRATSTAHAPHSPSAQPSLHPVSPSPRSHSKSVT